MKENKNTKNLGKNITNQGEKSITKGIARHLDYVANAIDNNSSNKVNNISASKNNSEKK